jgi:hypothetical protein
MTKSEMRKTRKIHTMKHMEYHHGECCDATFHGLHHWNKAMFEQLGWMILAKEHGMMDKISTYKNSIKRLKMAIEKKMKHMKDSDKKEDLMIMYHNVCCLEKHVDADFP